MISLRKRCKISVAYLLNILVKYLIKLYCYYFTFRNSFYILEFVREPLLCLRATGPTFSAATQQLPFASLIACRVSNGFEDLLFILVYQLGLSFLKSVFFISRP